MYYKSCIIWWAVPAATEMGQPNIPRSIYIPIDNGLAPRIRACEVTLVHLELGIFLATHSTGLRGACLIHEDDHLCNRGSLRGILYAGPEYFLHGCSAVEFHQHL